MPKFDDFLKAWTFDPENFNADTFKADIEKAHNDDFGAAQAKITILETDKENLLKENLKLKGENYDLMLKVPTKKEAGEDNAGKDKDDPEAISLEDFFEE